LYAQEVEDSVPVMVPALTETASYRRLLRNVEGQFLDEYGVNNDEEFSIRAKALFAKVLDKRLEADAWNARLEAKLKKMQKNMQEAKQQRGHGAEVSSSEDEAPESIIESDGVALEEVEKPEDFKMQNKRHKARGQRGQKRQLEDLLRQGFAAAPPPEPARPPLAQPEAATQPEAAGPKAPPEQPNLAAPAPQAEADHGSAKPPSTPFTDDSKRINVSIP
jgi:hypothetical protein